MFYGGRGQQLIRSYSLVLADYGYLVEGSPDIDGAVLDDSVDNLGDGRGEIWVGELRMEENLWA